MIGLRLRHLGTRVLPPVMLAAAVLFSGPSAAQEPMPRVSLQTSMGQIILELDRERAPLTVANFLRYVTEGHFNNTVFYRVVPRFVVQGGSVGADGNGKPVHDPIPLEANNGLPNRRGTIAMGRSGDPNSATAEFFINLVDNPGLDQQMGDTMNQTGYAVFGRVVEGMNVVDLMTTLPGFGGYGPFPVNAPLIPVTIRQARILDPAPAGTPPAETAPATPPAQK